MSGLFAFDVPVLTAAPLRGASETAPPVNGCQETTASDWSGFSSQAVTGAELIRARMKCGAPDCLCQNPRDKTHCPNHSEAGPVLTVLLREAAALPLLSCAAGCSYKECLVGLFECGALPKKVLYRTGAAQRPWTWSPEGGLTPSATLRPVTGLYLGETLSSMEDSTLVLLVDGEVATEAVLSHGISAVGLVASGPHRLSADMLTPLVGSNLVLAPSNTPAGTERMRSCASLLQSNGIGFRWFELSPGAGIDLGDWKDSPEELLNLIDETAKPLSIGSRSTYFIWADELDTVPSTEWLVCDFMVAGELGALVGPWGCGKSFVALDLACCIATGTAWHGREVLAGPVVYILGEGTGGIKARVKAWETVHGVTVKDIGFVPRPVSLLNDEGPQELVRQIVREISPRPRLVIIDTLQRAMVGGDENLQRDMAVVLEAAERIRRETGAAVWFVHHTNRGGDYRGSSVLPASLETMVLMTRSGDVLQFRCAKQKNSSEFESFRLALTEAAESLVPMPMRPVGPADDDSDRRVSGSFAQVLAALATAGEAGMSSSHWQRASFDLVGKSTFFRARKDLIEKGLVEKFGRPSRPLYRVTSNGSKLLSPERLEPSLRGSMLPPPCEGGSVEPAQTEPTMDRS